MPCGMGKLQRRRECAAAEGAEDEDRGVAVRSIMKSAVVSDIQIEWHACADVNNCEIEDMYRVVRYGFRGGTKTTHVGKSTEASCPDLACCALPTKI